MRKEREREAAHRLELLESVRAQQALLETLLDIQREISQRGPLQSVLDKITGGASGLLDGAGIALVLADPTEPENLILAATANWPAPATAAALAAARASMTAGGSVCHAGTGPDRERLRAAPVQVSGSIAGNLVAIQADTLDAEQERARLLSAFAQQISMALTDARTVEAMREAYRDPLTGLPHRAGDDLLTAVAERIRDTLRHADLAARLGGDEFAVLCEDASAEDALGLAERIAERVAEPFEIAGRTVYIGASIGVASCLAGRTDAAELLGNADTAMYRAKKDVTGQVVLFEPDLFADVVSTFDLQADLANALALGELKR